MVLVIDDEAALREVIEEILELSAIRCLSAANGQEGLQLFIENQSIIDVVLLDMQMPVMSGGDTLRELRKMNTTVEIVLMSGYPEGSTMEKFRPDPHLSYLEKPFTLEKLTMKIEGLLRKRGA